METRTAQNQIHADALAPWCRELPADYVTQLYGELRRLAQRYLRGERAGHTLQPTALLHEALLRIQESTGTRELDSQEFCAAAALVMRRVLVDHARRRNADKRGGGMIRIELDQKELPATSLPVVELLDLDLALEELSTLNPRHADVVHLRFFAGFTVDETAGMLKVSPATVKNDWRVARAWLLSRLRPTDPQ